MTPSAWKPHRHVPPCIRRHMVNAVLVWGEILCDECKPSEGAIVDRELAHAKLARRFNKLLRGE